MAFDEQLADRIRLRLADLENIEEKPMMGGLTFMVNGKMCVGIIKDELMCRIDPAEQDAALSKPGSRIMDFTARPMKGYILVDRTGMKTEADFNRWIDMALRFNPKAKASKKQ